MINKIFSSPHGTARTLCGGLAAIAFMLTMGTSPWTGEAAAKGRTEMKTEYARPGEVPYPEENPYTAEKAALGHKLFFDPRLSGSDYISCGTCHNPSFSWGDGLPTGFGHKMTKLGRRTPTILNSAWGELMMWDGRFDSLEEQALGPMGAESEMNQQLDSIVEELAAIPGYRTLFNMAFPADGLTIGNIGKAIATYERTIVSGIAPFDRWIAGEESAISSAAKRGFDLYNNKANCVACHKGWNMTDSSFHDIGLPDDDIGRGNVLKNMVKMQHAFKTPTLRNIVQRAPYMHDGSLGTLKEVIDHYSDGFRRRDSLSDEMKPLKLSEDEKADLLAFLLTLEGADQTVAAPILPANDQVPGAWLKRLSPAAGGKAETAECRTARLHLRRCN
jgi:cytochrome c peroxidase